MRQLGYRYKVEVELEITKEELEYLMFLSERHYDGKCRAASKPGKFGILNGIKFSMGDKEVTETILSIDDLSILTKITESEQWIKDRKMDLYWTMLQLLKTAIAELKRINE